ncbi:ScbR family autoregulator-binding transcription factor [Streptomyces monticola]|uniref:ScbR family autoregulator-binding transcription factor n=1 Tax=Streptomyces monticola TaxID=2666263 RepID=A0ABW2JX23_9ACTN
MQDRAAATRRAIIEAAARLFDELGYAATSISGVVSATGFTSGAVYFHFRNKEGLARAVVEAYHDSWPTTVARYTALDGSVLTRTVALSLAVARGYREDPIVRAGSRLWFERKAMSSPLPTPFVRWIGVTEQLLTTARDSGELDTDADLKRFSQVLVAGFFGTFSVAEALEAQREMESRVLDLWSAFLPGLGVTDTQAVLAEAAALNAAAT